MKETKEGLQVITKEFEGNNVQMTTGDNGEILFELYSTGMALGYVKKNSIGKTYAFKSRIDKVVENAEINVCVHGVHNYLTEEMLYDFMLEAKTEKCKAFRKWVTHEVLPQIRQTGGYIPINKEMSDDEIMAKALIVAQNTLKRKEELLRQKDIQLKEQEPLVELAKKRLDKNGLVSITDVTKTFNLKRGEVTKWAKDNGYLHKTRTEVNDKGANYFRVYYANNYRCVGVTENGLTLIHENFSKERE